MSQDPRSEQLQIRVSLAEKAAMRVDNYFGKARTAREARFVLED